MACVFKLGFFFSYVIDPYHIISNGGIIGHNPTLNFPLRSSTGNPYKAAE